MRDVGLFSGELVEISAEELGLFGMTIIAPVIKLLGLTLSATQPISNDIQEFLNRKKIFPVLLNAEAPGDPLLFLSGLTDKRLTKQEVDEFLAKKTNDSQKQSKATPDKKTITETATEKLEAKLFKQRFNIKFDHTLQLASMGYYTEQIIKNVDNRIQRLLTGPKGIMGSGSTIDLHHMPDKRAKERNRIDFKGGLVLTNGHIVNTNIPHFISIIGSVEPAIGHSTNAFGYLGECWAAGDVTLSSLLSIRIQNSFLQAKGKITLNSKLIMLERSDWQPKLDPKTGDGILDPKTGLPEGFSIFWSNIIDSSLHAHTITPSIVIEKSHVNTVANKAAGPETAARPATAAGSTASSSERSAAPVTTAPVTAAPVMFGTTGAPRPTTASRPATAAATLAPATAAAAAATSGPSTAAGAATTAASAATPTPATAASASSARKLKPNRRGRGPN